MDIAKFPLGETGIAKGTDGGEIVLNEFKEGQANTGEGRVMENGFAKKWTVLVRMRKYLADVWILHGPRVGTS